jgi:5-hydroxyisourate hydrolase-like protein (transthyretin family)
MVSMKLIVASMAVSLALAAPVAAFASQTVGSSGSQQIAAATAAAALSGRVVDSRSKAPLAGVKVTAFPLGSTVAESSTMTDVQGRFTLAGLRGGDYRLLFEHSGYPKSLAGGIDVKPHDHLVLISAFALQSKSGLEQVRMVDPCGSLVQPGQVADVYVICSGH